MNAKMNDDLPWFRALGAENRTRARSEFDVRHMLSALEGVYRDVLGL